MAGTVPAANLPALTAALADISCAAVLPPTADAAHYALLALDYF